MLERQELWCHDCNRYVQFDIDVSLNGNHVITCPNCKHEHCRVVRNGRITDIRWDQMNRAPAWTGTNYYSATSVGTSTTSTYATYTGTGTSSSAITYSSWMDLTSTS